MNANSSPSAVQGLIGSLDTEEKSFRKGYTECLSEVAKMMMFSPAIDDSTRQKLVRPLHLHKSFST